MYTYYCVQDYVDGLRAIYERPGGSNHGVPAVFTIIIILEFCYGIQIISGAQSHIPPGGVL